MTAIRHPDGRPRRAWPRLGAVLALAGLAFSQPAGLSAQTESLVDRMANEQLQAYEKRLTNDLSAALSRYVSPSRFVLSVKVIWNREVIPAASEPALAPSRQKLPGFPIFVRSPDSPDVDDLTPPITRLEVRVLLDETVPEYYERFVRKIIPIVARFESRRGDQVVVVKETFPSPTEAGAPPTLSESEMQQLMQRLEPGGAAAPSAATRPAGEQEAGAPTEAVQLAYDEGRYADALRVVQTAFQRATSNAERARLLAMEGSIQFTLKNLEAARAAWQRALVFDPGNVEVHRILDFMEGQQAR